MKIETNYAHTEIYFVWPIANLIINQIFQQKNVTSSSWVTTWKSVLHPTLEVTFEWTLGLQTIEDFDWTFNTLIPSIEKIHLHIGLFFAATIRQKTGH